MASRTCTAVLSYLVLLGGVPTMVGALRAEEPQCVNQLLRSAGIEPQTVTIAQDQLDLMLCPRGPAAPLVNVLMARPLEAADYARVTVELLAKSANEKPAEALAQLSRWNGRLVRRGLVDDPVAKWREKAKQPGALRAALADARMIRAELESIPASVQEAAALLLFAERDALEWIKRSYTKPGGSGGMFFWGSFKDRLYRGPRTGSEEELEERNEHLIDFNRRVAEWTERFAVRDVLVAAEDLLFAVEAASQILKADKSLVAADFHVVLNSSLGKVVLCGSKNDHHRYSRDSTPAASQDATAEDAAVQPSWESLALIIDIGGDDTYANAGANIDPDYPLSICLDLSGNDTYEAGADSGASFGAGVFGVGILVDEAGNDTYRGGKLSQGAANFGVGVLIDRAGDDTYSAIDESQGSATAGYGLLIDLAGNDTYESYRNSQAYAGPNAAAALVDLAGNDHYIANDTDIRYPSAQNKEHNNSMSQGAASGWRADYSDGLSVNGGVAALVDAAGDDEYSCGLFGQGSGYWQAAGMLVDLAGKDRYRGHWYVQGASAHFAAGVLLDRAGDDEYVANQNMSQGAGHDVGIGVLADDAGNDRYLGTTLGLGASNAAGIGLFIDRGGEDVYQTPASSCLGWAGPNDGYRSLFNSYGLFFDLGGADRFEGRDGGPPREGARDGGRWRSTVPEDADPRRLFGLGFDEK